jgi:predicted DNA-binding transcriptional regulator YafY
MPPAMQQAFRDGLELRIEYTHTNGDTIKELIEPLDILQHNSKGLHLIAYDKVSKSHHAIALKRVIKIELNQ